jgi:pimeloyl-ACP methyl ester carboxylesterase
MIAFLLIFFFAIALFLFPFWLILANPFPQPSGQWRVGTTELTWDSASYRGIIAKVWYPARDAAGGNSPYIDDIDRALSVMTTGLNPLVKLVFNRLYLGRVVTPAISNATLARSSEGLILFSPGFAGVNWINSFYALTLASHGFIVIGINHPGISAASLLADGSQVKFMTLEKDVFADADRVDSLVAELSQQQAGHISMVVDRAIALNADPNSFLYQSININRIFAVGHSLGGAASFIACGRDQRIAKGINFDGLFIDAIDTDYTGKELLLVLSDRDQFRPKNQKMRLPYDQIMGRDVLRIDQLDTKANLQRILLPMTGHLNFADAPLIFRPMFVKSIGLVGKVDGLEILSKTSAIAMDFLGQV